METRTKFSGFTLIELVLVMTIAAILIGLGVPSFRYVTNVNRVASEVNGLLGDMQYGRGEAIKEGQTVTVCTSANGTSCAGTTTWQNGWIVFADANDNAQVDPGEAVLRVQNSFGSTDTFLADNNIQAVTFNREGFAMGLPGTVTVTLHTVNSSVNWTRCLAITIIGSLATESAGTGNCT